MGKRANVIFVAGVAAILASTWQGSGGAATRKVPVGAFDRIKASGVADVEIRTGAEPSVEISGPEKELDRLRIAASGGELSIGTAARKWWRGIYWGLGRHERTLVTVTVPALRALSSSGPGDVTIDRLQGPAFTLKSSGPADITIGAIDTQTAEFDLTGPGDLRLSGRAASARFAIHGPGDVKARDFTAGDVAIDVVGPGDVRLAATRTATVKVSGPGDVTVTGGAKCAVTRSGPGDVRCG